jgi:hypothetical protein
MEVFMSHSFMGTYMYGLYDRHAVCSPVSSHCCQFEVGVYAAVGG